jgi:hypothetical protein
LAPKALAYHAIAVAAPSTMRCGVTVAHGPFGVVFELSVTSVPLGRVRVALVVVPVVPVVRRVDPLVPLPVVVVREAGREVLREPVRATVREEPFTLFVGVRFAFALVVRPDVVVLRVVREEAGARRAAMASARARGSCRFP